MKRIIFSLVTLCLMCVKANARDYRTKGYMGFVEETIATNFDKTTLWSFNTVHGYQMNQNSFIGAGIGIVTDSEKNNFVVPLYGDIRCTMLKTKVAPYIEARVGYSFADLEGIYISPTLGVDIAFTEKFGLYAGIAYEHFENTTSGAYGISYTRTLNTMSIRVGIHF